MNCNCNDKAIVIVRGNDTNFNDGNFLTINLNTTILNLSTFKATFKLGSIIRQIDDISSGIIHLNFTAAETFRLPQFCYGTLNLIDTSNRIATIESLIPFQVISVVNGNAIATEPYTLNFDVKQGGETILNVSVESAVTVEVGQTTTLPAGSAATVTNSGTGNHLVLDFGIPRGADGVNSSWGNIIGDIYDQTDLQNELNSISGGLSDSITAFDNKYDSITGGLDQKIDSVSGALSDSITGLDNKYDSITSGLDNKIDSVNGALSDSITVLDSVVSGNYTALDNKIDSVNGALSDSITALDSVVSSNYNTLDGKIDSINGALSDSISAIDSTIGSYGNIVTHNVAEFATAAQGALADSAVQPNDNVSELVNDAQYITIQPVNTETTNRENADLALQQQIDAIVASSDVFDVVGTYADLQNYDISTVPVNDIIKVLVDSTHNDAATYYRCVENNNVKSWSYIGSEGAYYTKGEADSTFVPQTRTVNSKALSSNITLTASDVGALPSSTTIGAGVLTIQKNSTDVGTFGANDTSNKTINLSIPTKLSDITVSAGSNIQISGDTISATDTTYSAGDGIAISSGGQSITLTQTLPYTFNSARANTNFVSSANFDQTKERVVILEVPLNVTYVTFYLNGVNSSYGIIVENTDLTNIYVSDGSYSSKYNTTSFPVSGSHNYLKFVIDTNNTTDIYYGYDNSAWTLLLSKDRSNQNADTWTNGVNICNDDTTGWTLSYMSVAYGGVSNAISCDNTIARVSDIHNATLTIQKNGSMVDTFTANASSDKTINITVPTNNNELTNGAGYITGITSSDVTTALGFTPYNSTNPSGYQANVIETVKVNGTALTPTNKAVDINAADIDLSNLSSAGDNRLHALKSYEDAGELLTDTEGLADVNSYAHSTFDSSKFTVTGSPTITSDGFISGCNSNNYVLFSDNLDITGKTVHIEFEYVAGSFVSESGNEFLFIIKQIDTATRIGAFRSAASNNTNTFWQNNSSEVSRNQTGNCKPNVGDIVKYVWNIGTERITSEVFLNGVSVETDYQLRSAINLTTVNFYIGGWQNGTTNSQLDLKKIKITVNGVPVFSGNKTGMDTIKPDDYTVVGSPTITADGVASGFSSSKYLTIPTINVTDKDFEIDLEQVTTPSAFTSASAIIGGSGNSNNFIIAYSGQGKFYVSSTSNYFTTFYSDTISVNTNYYVKAGVKDSTVYLKVSTNNSDWATYTQTLTNAYTSLVEAIGISNRSLPLITSIDLNNIKIYVNGSLVYQPCLKIPYTLSKTGSKVVNSVYRDRVADMYNQFGYSPYYTLSDTDFTLPQGEVYGLIKRLNSRPDYRNSVTTTDVSTNANAYTFNYKSLAIFKPLTPASVYTISVKPVWANSYSTINAYGYMSLEFNEGDTVYTSVNATLDIFKIL